MSDLGEKVFRQLIRLTNGFDTVETTNKEIISIVLDKVIETVNKMVDEEDTWHGGYIEPDELIKNIENLK